MTKLNSYRLGEHNKLVTTVIFGKNLRSERFC